MKSIDDACVSYNHGFGLMNPADQENIRREAREWLRSFHLEDHSIEVLDEKSGIIENKLWTYILWANKIMMRKLGDEYAQEWHEAIKNYIHTLPDGDDCEV